MNTALAPEILTCGCEREYVNGRWVWIYCEEHETDSFQETTRPLKKVRKRQLMED